MRARRSTEMNRGKWIMHSVRGSPCRLKKTRRAGQRSELAICRGDKRFQQLLSRWTNVYLMEISQIPQNTFT